MHFSTICFLIFGAAVATSAEPQFQYGSSNPLIYSGQAEQGASDYYFRSGSLNPTAQNHGKPENRFIFGTVSITLGTTTSTVTVTISTTCTTSKAAIKICSPSGRRRRGLGLTAQKNGLYFNEEEDSIFLPYNEPEPVSAVESEPVREEREAPLVPMIIQPGYNVEGLNRNGRFLIAFQTSTSYTTTTSTYTRILTALCSSTTGFGSCSGSGK